MEFYPKHILEVLKKVLTPPSYPEIVPTGRWHKVGSGSISIKDATDVGLVLIGGRPKYHEWVQISRDRKRYRLGPEIAKDETLAVEKPNGGEAPGPRGGEARPHDDEPHAG